MGGCCSAPDKALSIQEEQELVAKNPASSTSDAFGLSNYFESQRLLGEGGSGETWLMKDKTTKELVAVKMIKRPIPKALHQMLLQEIMIQRDLGEGHINIVTSREVMLTPSHMAIVMEYVSGGTLTKYVSDRWKTVGDRGGLFLTEEEARYFFKQFLSAVEYCHQHNVAHRDLKLDNTLLDDNHPPFIKICDFGFAKGFNPDSNMYTQIGTPVYMSPEVISSKRGRMGYDGQKADIWASGVLLFVMLLGMFPYEHAEHPDPNTSAAQIEVWLQQIKSRWRENARVKEAAQKLSADCRDLLDHIFDLNEKRRLSIQDIRSHPWYSKPLMPEHEAAWNQLQAAQKELESKIKRTEQNSRLRDEGLKDLMSAAGNRGNPGDKIKRVSLMKIDASNSFMPADRDMGNIQE